MKPVKTATKLAKATRELLINATILNRTLTATQYDEIHAALEALDFIAEERAFRRSAIAHQAGQAFHALHRAAKVDPNYHDLMAIYKDAAQFAEELTA